MVAASPHQRFLLIGAFACWPRPPNGQPGVLHQGRTNYWFCVFGIKGSAASASCPVTTQKKASKPACSDRTCYRHWIGSQLPDHARGGEAVIAW